MSLVSTRQKVGITGILMCAALGVLSVQLNVWLVLAGVVIIALLALAIAFPDISTLVVIFVIYTNLGAISKHVYGFPDSVANSFGLLLGIPLISYLIIRRERLVIDRAFLLMLVFLAILGAASLFAVDIELAMDWIFGYLTGGLVLYLLIINVIRKFTTFRRVIWSLLLAGSLLGGLTLYQEITQSFDNNFYGLSDRARSDETGVVEEGGETFVRINRAGGPLAAPNRFAQILIVLLPLALFRIWGERSLWLRALAALAFLSILGGMLLTYSRGAFVAFVLLILMMILMRYIRPYQILVALAGLALLITVAPGYLDRIDTIRGVEGLLFEDTEQQPDYVTRGRVTEMLAALYVFLDYPVLGVGPGQYSRYYSIDYHLNPDIALRYIPTTRRAHTLYFELGAETGVLGLGTFLAIVLLMLYRLWRARVRWIYSRPEYANVATALFLSILGYLGTAIFLHLSFQRYYWLLIALAGAAIQILDNEIPEHAEQNEVPPERHKVLERIGVG